MISTRFFSPLPQSRHLIESGGSKLHEVLIRWSLTICGKIDGRTTEPSVAVHIEGKLGAGDGVTLRRIYRYK